MHLEKVVRLLELSPKMARWHAGVAPVLTDPSVCYATLVQQYDSLRFHHQAFTRVAGITCDRNSPCQMCPSMDGRLYGKHRRVNRGRPATATCGNGEPKDSHAELPTPDHLGRKPRPTPPPGSVVAPGVRQLPGRRRVWEKGEDPRDERCPAVPRQRHTHGVLGDGQAVGRLG